MSYRVELAVSARAGCQNKECKDAGVKIAKGELRLGTWVTIKDHSSWQWRHWGCVSGKVIQNIRNVLEGEDNRGSGEYRWDFLDGYDDDGKGGLASHPDLQAKVRRCIEQGFIDAEDWKGDPEMNELGKSGTRTPETQKKMKEEKSAQMGSLTELQSAWLEAKQQYDALVNDGKGLTQVAKGLKKKCDEFAKEAESRRKMEEKEKALREKGVTPTPNSSKKRGRAKQEEDEDESPSKKKKKATAKKVKKEESDEDEIEDEEEEIIPAKKARGKKAVKKEESDEEEVMPAKKIRGSKAVKKEESDEEEAEVIPAKKARGKKAPVKQEEIQSDEEVLTAKKPAKQARGKKAPAAAVKKEAEVEDEQDDVKPAKVGRGRKRAVAKKVVEDEVEDAEEEGEGENMEEKAEVEVKQKPKTTTRKGRSARA